MNQTPAFLGEFELSQEWLQDPTIAAFDSLPLGELIRSLANEFCGKLELMPYQKDGDEIKLLVSAYLQPRENEGTVIAVLIRESYPKNPDELLRFVEIASSRLASLEAIAARFEKESLQTAKKYLDQLLQRIRNTMGRAENPRYGFGA